LKIIDTLKSINFRVSSPSEPGTKIILFGFISLK